MRFYADIAMNQNTSSWSEQGSSYPYADCEIESAKKWFPTMVQPSDPTPNPRDGQRDTISFDSDDTNRAGVEPTQWTEQDFLYPASQETAHYSLDDGPGVSLADTPETAFAWQTPNPPLIHWEAEEPELPLQIGQHQVSTGWSEGPEINVTGDHLPVQQEDGSASKVAERRVLDTAATPQATQSKRRECKTSASASAPAN